MNKSTLEIDYVERVSGRILQKNPLSFNKAGDNYFCSAVG